MWTGDGSAKTHGFLCGGDVGEDGLGGTPDGAVTTGESGRFPFPFSAVVKRGGESMWSRSSGRCWCGAGVEVQSWWMDIPRARDNPSVSCASVMFTA